MDQLRAAELARAQKLPVILDVGELRDGTSELIAATDILIVSERAAVGARAARRARPTRSTRSSRSVRAPS